MSTRNSFREELDSLQRDLLRMGVFVSEAIDKAVQSLSHLDSDLARQVIAGDDTVDRMLIDIEKNCLQLMALQQPMARDLRAIGTALKIVTDLERMADHATDIARVTVQLEGERLIHELVQIPTMAHRVQQMTRMAVEAFVHRDVELARQMIALDDEIDRLYAAIFDEMLGIMRTQPKYVRQAAYLLLVALYLERVGDHATNLGEWTIYLVTGELQNLNR